MLSPLFPKLKIPLSNQITEEFLPGSGGTCDRKSCKVLETEQGTVYLLKCVNSGLCVFWEVIDLSSVLQFSLRCPENLAFKIGGLYYPDDYFSNIWTGKISEGDTM